MKFDLFVDTMKNLIKEYLPGEYEDAEVVVKANKKLNNSYLGMTILKQETAIAPVINLEELYGYYSQNPAYSISDALQETAAAIQREATAIDLEPASLADYEKVKKQLYIRVFSAEQNADVLQDIPYIKQADLAITAHIMLKKDEDGFISTTVNDQMLKTYGITKEQLFRDAEENSPVLLPAQIERMDDVIAKLFFALDTEGAGISQDEMAEMMDSMGKPEEQMLVVSNEKRMNGAAAIFYPGIMEQIGELIKGDYFILPSSTHETILIPDNGRYLSKELDDMVKAVNQSQVAPKDRLSDKAYHYDIKNKRFELAETYEQQKAQDLTQTDHVPEETKKQGKKKHKGLSI